MTLKISEQFYSLQGEGLTIGLPCNFVRFRGCALRCSFCDTKYAWKSEGPEVSVEEALEKLDKRASIVVITGGEPLLYKDDKDFLNFLEACSDQDYEIEVETCALPEIPSKEMEDFVDRWNVSPKMLGSQPPEYADLLKKYEETLPWFVESGESSTFKFVVSDEEEVEEVLSFLWNYHIPHGRVYLMPEGGTKEKQDILMPKIAQLALDHGLAMTPRLQALVWDGKRGV